jgi:hypothetical protein
VTTVYDIAGRPTCVSSGTGTCGQPGVETYANNVAYASHSPLKSATFGNGLVESSIWDPVRLQPQEVSTAVPGSSALLDLSYYYCPSQGLSCSTNNGNVEGAKIATLGALQAFGYDGANRLNSAQETVSGVTTWSRSHDYDAYGNGWVSAWSGIPPLAFTPIVSTNYNTNNQLIIENSGYDNAGNQTGIGVYGFSYDAENRLTSSRVGNAD